MKTQILSLEFGTQQNPKERCTNITPQIQQAVDDMKLFNGFIHVQVMHTTCGMALQEDEPCLFEDLFALLEWMAPADGHYKHDDFSVRTKNLDENRKERKNGYAHLRALLLQQVLLLRVESGKLCLGTWQQVLLFDFDAVEQFQMRKIYVSAMPQPMMFSEGK